MRTNTAIRPKGFTIFYAVLVTSLSLAIGLAIYDLTIRELQLSATANQSQQAIYAADSGAECALNWDINCSVSGCTAGSAFPTSTQSTKPSSGAGLWCQGQDITTSWDTSQVTASAATTTFQVTGGGAVCATVVVAKYGTPTRTSVTAYGYYNCSGGVGQVQRALQVNY